MGENIERDNISFHYSVTNEPTDSFALHCHSYYEVYYFVGGRVSYLVEGKRYEPKPHSILLMAPGTFHGVKIESAEDYERYSLHFHAGLLSDPRREFLLSPFAGKNGPGICFEGVNAYSLENYFRSLMECAHMEEKLSDCLIPIRLEALLSQILRMQLQSTSSTAKSQSHTVEEVVDYLNQNLAAPITLDSLSEQFFLSKNHLNYLFKQATGTTVKNYLIHKRIAAAHALIRQGSPAAAAAEQVGFGDYSAFFKAYKKIIGTSPADVHRTA